MTLRVNAEFTLTAIESLDEDDTPGVSNRRLTHQLFNRQVLLNEESAPPVSLISEQVIEGADGTIDLTALPGTGGATLDATGLKLQLLRLTNLSEANTLTVAVGASNGYDLGASLVVPPGGSVQAYLANGAPTVASGAKTLDWELGADQQAQVTLILG